MTQKLFEYLKEKMGIKEDCLVNRRLRDVNDLLAQLRAKREGTLKRRIINNRKAYLTLTGKI